MHYATFNVFTTQNHFSKNFVRNMPTNNDFASEIATKILAEIMLFRRVPESMPPCSNSDCHKCTAPHLPKIISAINNNKPVTFVLPAFPGKSPNLEKVLGPLPDQAERLSLLFLDTLCQRIKKIYTPGIKIILCADGRVFSDVVGMLEPNVSAYQVELNNLIEEMSIADIVTFNLDDFYKGLSFVQMRDELLKNYGNPVDFFKHKIHNATKPLASPDEQEAKHMYCGITRFLFEDALYKGQTKSRSAIQKESRHKAYEVIRRSNAWSQLIAALFPQAVRLSIHPQTCEAKKLGIRLIGNESSWMTPWHGVAVESKNGYILLKRTEAEALGAKLICSADGRHSHYTLLTGV